MILNASARGLLITTLGYLTLIFSAAFAARQKPEIQPQQVTPKVQVTVNAALIPVVVRDAQGRAIGNLKKEDFQVFDRNKLQEISGFSIEKRGQELPVEGRSRT